MRQNTKLVLFSIALFAITVTPCILVFTHPPHKPVIHEEPYTVSTYICYSGSWTILHIHDKYKLNPQVNFYLAYHDRTHQTVTANTLTEMYNLLG